LEGQLKGNKDKVAAVFGEEYEWYHPSLSGQQPGARGYHAACASPDGIKVYLFGGIADQASCNTLAGEAVHCVQRPSGHITAVIRMMHACV
jgi:hypothetical protein